MSRFAFGPSYEEVAVLSRFIFGPSYSDIVVEPLPVLPDVVVGTSPAGAVGRTATVNIPPYDPATSNPPVALHSCYVLAPPDFSSDAKVFLDSVDANHVGHSTAIAPGDVAITVPTLPGGTYHVQFVVEYAS